MPTVATITAGGATLQPVILNGTSASNPVLIPANYQVVTILTPLQLTVPAVSGFDKTNPDVGAKWKLQTTLTSSASPNDTWYDLYALDLVNGPVQMSFPFSAQQALTLPAWYLGAGYLRVSTYDTKQAQDTTWTFTFTKFYK